MQAAFISKPTLYCMSVLSCSVVAYYSIHLKLHWKWRGCISFMFFFFILTKYAILKMKIISKTYLFSFFHFYRNFTCIWKKSNIMMTHLQGCEIIQKLYLHELLWRIEIYLLEVFWVFSGKSTSHSTQEFQHSWKSAWTATNFRGI